MLFTRPLSLVPVSKRGDFKVGDAFIKLLIKPLEVMGLIIPAGNKDAAWVSDVRITLCDAQQRVALIKANHQI